MAQARRILGLRRRLRGALGAEAVRASRLAVPRRRLGPFIRYLPAAFVFLVVVVAVFFVGLGIRRFALAWSELLFNLWPGLLAVAVAVVALGAWWLWWRLPKRQADRLRHVIRDPKNRADVEDNFRKTISQIFGGAAVLAGAAFAYWQFTDQRQTSQQQLQASHDLLISNQVAKGFELLGNKDGQIEQRLGGIYALEGVMNTSEQYHRPVLEGLCAFMREKTMGAAPPTADVQAALTVIGRRDTKNERPSAWHPYGGVQFKLLAFNLAGAHIPNTELWGANLNDADLGGADLTGADLLGADLSGANLIGANLRGAHLNGANPGGAFLDTVNLSDADLTEAKNVTQDQLDQACGTVSPTGLDELDPPLTFHPKPCPRR